MGDRNQATQNTPRPRYKDISANELPGGPVILHVGNREIHLDNMQAVFRWMERNSNLGGGQWLNTDNGRIWVNNRREVDVIFYRRVSTDPNNRVSMRTIHGDVAFGRSYEPGVSGHSPRQLIDNPNARVIGIAHTHPWGRGEWAIDFAANDVVEMDYGPSVGDVNSDRAVDSYAGYNVRAWVIQNSNIMEY
jgi:hypothetical protein